MSGFWGIFRPDGGPVDMDAFNQMCKASEREGFDGMETHVEDGIAMGHLMLRVSPESEYDRQPLKSDCGNYLLVGHFRLDYRDELGDKLGLTQAELEKTPDSRLALMAYIKWKEKCVHHLEGDWAFALVNSSFPKMFLAKDKLGYSSLFYTIRNNVIYFSTFNQSLFSKGRNINLNILQLYRLSLEGLGLSKGETLIDHIYTLSNASFLIFNEDNANLVNQYYTLDLSIKINYKYEKDLIQDFHSLYANAVRTRIPQENKIGLFLSSGLDSSSVAYYLNSLVKDSLALATCYTSIPAYKNENSNIFEKKYSEKDDVLKLSQEFTNLSFKLCAFHEAKISDLIKDETDVDIFNPIIHNNSFWISGYLKTAQAQKVRRVLNGQLGNLTVSWTPSYLVIYAFIKKRFRLGLNLIVLKSRKAKKNILRIFYSELIRPLFLSAKGIIKAIYFKYKFDYFHDSCFRENRLLKKEWQRHIKVYEFYHKTSFILSPEGLRKEIFFRNSKYSGAKWHLIGQNLGIEITDPTADCRLVDFLFSIDPLWFGLKGERKYLFKTSFNQRLPISFLQKEFNPIQSSDIGNRIKDDIGIKKILDELISNSLISNFFDVEKFYRLYIEIISAPQHSSCVQNSNIFLKYLSIMVFFKKMSNFDPKILYGKKS